MKTVPATDAKNRLGALLDDAQHEPIVIRRQDRDIAVVLSMAEYERLTTAYGAGLPDSRGALVAEDAAPFFAGSKATVSQKGHIVLPAELREADDVQPGQELEVERVARGHYRLVRRAAAANAGAVDWLLACPSKGYFVPVDSDSTDTL